MPETEVPLISASNRKIVHNIQHLRRGSSLARPLAMTGYNVQLFKSVTVKCHFSIGLTKNQAKDVIAA